MPYYHLSKNSVLSIVFLFVFSLIYTDSYSQRIRVGLTGGYQMSFSQYDMQFTSVLQSIPYFHTSYGIEAGIITHKIGIRIFASRVSYSTDISTLKAPSIPRKTFGVKHYANPALQIGLSFSKPVFIGKRGSIDISLSTGINKWIAIEKQVEYVKDTFSTTTAYGIAHLVIHAHATSKPVNMFLGGGIQATYQLANHLFYNIALQYQLGIGILRGMDTKYYTWGDYLGPSYYLPISTTSGSNVSARMAILYEFGEIHTKKE